MFKAAIYDPFVSQEFGFMMSALKPEDLATLAGWMAEGKIKSVIDLSNDPNFGPSFRALVAEGQHDPVLASQLVDRIFGPRIEAAKERLRAAQQDGQLANRPS